MTTDGLTTRPRDVVRLRAERSGELLNLVRRGRAQTTGELAVHMGWARSTVQERVQLLLKEGLLTSTATIQQGRGRPAAGLEFNPTAAVVLAVQVGVSGSRVALTDLATEVLWSDVIDTGITSSPGELVSTVHETAARALRALDEDASRLWGIGIGLPGKVELATASPADAGEWLRYPVAEALSEPYGVPVFVDQDVNLLALGEQRFSWPQADVFVCVKVGTVIGCGVVINGSVVRGAAGLAGEIGHTHVSGHDEPCACGNKGCLNVVAGGGALATALNADGVPTANAREVARLARDGSLPAVQAVRAAGRDIGEALAGTINLLNPTAITVWGYLADAEDHLFSGLREGIYSRAVPAATGQLTLERARLGDEAGIRGAAMVVVDNVLDPATLDARLSRHLDQDA